MTPAKASDFPFAWCSGLGSQAENADGPLLGLDMLQVEGSGLKTCLAASARLASLVSVSSWCRTP